VDGRLDAHLCATRVDRDIRTAHLLELHLHHHPLGHIVCGLALIRQESVRRRIRRRELHPVLIDIHRDDLDRAKRLGDRYAQQPHRPGAKHHRAVPRPNTRLLCDVHGDGQRLDQRALAQAHALGQFVAEVGGQLVRAAQGAVEGRGGGETHVLAEVVGAGLAAGAAAARHAGLEGDAVADGQRGHGRADGRHDAGRLVPEHHGRRHDELADRSVLPVVHVRAADARVGDAYEHVVGRGEGGRGARADGDGELFLEDEGWVLGRAG